MHFLLHGKSYLLFSDFLKRWSFQKNCARIWSYCIIGADDISFSWKYDLTPWTENERWSSSKKKRKQKQNKKKSNYDTFFKCSEKMVFSKKSRRNMIFLVLSGKMVLFFPKDDLSQKIHGNMILSVYTCKCYKHGITPPVTHHPQSK